MVVPHAHARILCLPLEWFAATKYVDAELNDPRLRQMTMSGRDLGSETSFDRAALTGFL